MKEMKEIDLKQTPLSEIDLSKIDYEKSYVNFQDNHERIIEITREDGRWCVPTENFFHGWHFTNNGVHQCSCEDLSLHLFYKELHTCSDCKFLNERYYIEPCKSCLASFDKKGNVTDFSNWQPVEAKVSAKSNPYPIIIEYEDLGDTVKIVKIEGVMSKKEVIKHVGHTTAAKYFSVCAPYMHFDLGKLSLTHKANNGEFIYISLYIGSSYDKNSFLVYIETMKLASERLAQLIKESKQPKIERIEI